MVTPPPILTLFPYTTLFRSYFLYRDGKYIDMAGKSFRDFLARKIPEVAHIEPMLSDWADHLTTIFPEVRLKSFLEMRDRKSTRLNSSHANISYAVFCLKKKK